MMRIENANDLVKTIARAGLTHDFAAIMALVTQGISGHMELHRSGIACEAGATGADIEVLAKKLVKTGKISVSRPQSFLQDLRCNPT
jgi:hydroxymethylglutaryl-CoA reductase